MDYGWIAAAHDEVAEILTKTTLRVRPSSAPVPEAMRGTALGDVFSRLARMNDGNRHRDLRRLVDDMIVGYDLVTIANLAAKYARERGVGDVALLTMAAMVGISNPESALTWMRDFAAAIPIGASGEAIERGIRATDQLVHVLPAGRSDDENANALGFLFQAHAATTALIMNTLAGIGEAPVTLTRRFAEVDTEFAGQLIRGGDVVVALLGPSRLHFGAGPHQCPGRQIAETIADAASRALRDEDLGHSPRCGSLQPDIER